MAGTADTWFSLGTAQDGATLQGKRNTTLSTGTMSLRLIRTVSRGRTRVLWSMTGLADATFDAWLAHFET